MAKALTRTRPSADPEAVVSALRTCVTEQDVAQVLYVALRPIFGYEVVNLHVLDREGWFHSTPVAEGVLQDTIYQPLQASVFEPFYRTGEPQVVHPTLPPEAGVVSRGPSSDIMPRTVIWVPIRHQAELIGSVVYQTYAERAVAGEEMRFLEAVHHDLGVMVANARLNTVTRDQALRLGALNQVARALASTLDEKEILAALRSTVSRIIPVDRVVLVVRAGEGDGRLLTQTARSFTRRLVALSSPSLAAARPVLSGKGPHVTRHPTRGSRYGSVIWVPIVEAEEIRGALALQAHAARAYEQSTVSFAAQVADQTSLALRNAWSYQASEAQRRRLEVVNGVGRRLISSLDRWSIMRALREELALHLQFDVFILAAVRDVGDGEPLAEGYGYDSGHEQRVPAVPLGVAGPSREAYETKAPVLLRRNPWARVVEARRPAHESFLATAGAAFFVSRPGHRQRTIARSVIWVPVLHGDRVSALLSVQSYRDDAFSEEDVKLLQDIAAHVSLALDNADHYTEAQTERGRLEALHVIELGIAAAVDERGIAEAAFIGIGRYLAADVLMLAYVDQEGRLAGYGLGPKVELRDLVPVPVEQSSHFRRVLASGSALEEWVDPAGAEPGAPWPEGEEARSPERVLWVPVFQEGRAVAALSVQRFANVPFITSEVQLLESTAPVVGIALRTVRLHRANQLALDHSLRIQEVAALAGHDLTSTVASIAEQALTMLGSAGVCCWAFDAEGRITASRSSGSREAEKVLGWGGWHPAGALGRDPVSGLARGRGWMLLPLWYGERLVGALGSIHGPGEVGEPGGPELDFARHAAVAMENARLAAETRGRIRTLEAVAAFTNLDPTQLERTQAEMGRLLEQALAPDGGLWLYDPRERALVRTGDASRRAPLEDRRWLLEALRAERPGPRLKDFLASLGGEDLLAAAVLAEGGLAGLLTARPQDAPRTETRRLMGVLAGQAGVVLGRLRLVGALERERQTMNAMLESSPVGVTLQDSAQRIVYANPAVERLYGAPAESMVGRTLDDVLAEAKATLLPGEEPPEPGTRELKIQSPERVLRLRSVAMPVRGGDAGEGILALHEDVTQQRQMMEAKDFMLRAIGHEVRSPAAAMRNVLASVIQWQDEIDPMQRGLLIQEAYEMSDRLLNLVEGQLIISKLETRRFEPAPAPVNVPQCVQQVMGVLRHRYGQRVDDVRVSLDPGLPAAYCEPTHLTQVLTNLVGNALEYTSGAIEVTGSGVEGWLEITVSDDGPGLAQDGLEMLFQKTGSAGRNRSRGGLGLGLYLCRLVVERSFGGKIWLDRRGKGATFRFTVPSVARAGSTAAAAS